MKNIPFIKSIAGILLLWLLLPLPGYSQREKRKRPANADINEMRLREAEFYFTEGMKYFILEDYTKALGSFQRVSDLNPEESVVHYRQVRRGADRRNPPA